MLEFEIDGTFTPLTTPLSSVDRLTQKLESAPASHHESIRLHIPRVLRSIYNIRNRRDVGHVGGDVSPNLGDANLLLINASWVLAELVRLYFACSLGEAQHLVDGLAERKIPLIQDFDGFLKILNPQLTVSQRTLVLLYHRGAAGASRAEIGSWLKGIKSSTVSSVLSKLERDALVHRDGRQCQITRRGIAFVETQVPLELASQSALPTPSAPRRRRTQA